MKLPTERMKKIPFIGIREIFEKARSFERQGKSIIHMEIGRPDFDTPAVAKEAAIKALKEGFVHYTSNYGMDELKRAIADKLREENKVEYNPDDEIIVTTGAVEGLALAMFGLLDIGDQVLVPSPCFPAYTNQIKLAGADVVSVPLKIENGFKLDIEELRRKITPKSKMLVINSPQNPTGSVLEKDDLEKIADFAKEHDLFVVSDECYERIIYDAEHISIASLPGMQERTIIVNACSKTYSMTGWRIGFVASTPEIIDSMVRVHQDVTTCACSFAQAGAVEALRHGRSAVEAMVREFRRRRDLVVKYLDQIEGLEYVKPQGAFYVFPSIKNFNMGAEEFCDYILKEAGVALVPGNAFGDYGEDFVRIAYSSSYEKIEEGMQRIKEAIAKI